jgi:hypothetical protein
LDVGQAVFRLIALFKKIDNNTALPWDLHRNQRRKKQFHQVMLEVKALRFDITIQWNLPTGCLDF